MTRSGPGADRGEPDKYYPTGRSTRGCRRVAILNDGEVYGSGVGVLVRRTARRLGMRVVHASRTLGPRRALRRGIARRVRRSRAQCVAYTGITANGAVPLFRKLARALPRAQLFGSDGIAESGFADPKQGGVPARGRAPRAAGGGDRGPAGAEAMRLLLDAVATVGPRRRAVVRWLRDVRGRQSVLGTYSFDRFGDTTLRDYGLYGIRGGSLVWAGVVRAP